MPTQRPSSPAIVFGIGALALLGVIALFQVVLEPPERIPCSSELAPGTFRETLVPAHLAAAAILWAASRSSARTAAGSRRSRPSRS